MGENEWLPCERCFQFLPLVDNQGYKLSIRLILFPATSLFFNLVRYYDVLRHRESLSSAWLSGRYETDGEVNGQVR